MPTVFRRSSANCGVIFLLFVALTARAADTGTVWLARTWDGLPDDGVTGVAQTPDGYLWVATAGGLMRFDGVRFQEFPLANIEGVPNRVVRAMLCDRHGCLWLGMDRGPIVCISPTSVQVFTNVPDARATVIAEDADGRVWVTYTEGKLTQIANDRVTEFGSDTGWPAQGTSSLATDAAGRLWFSKGNRVGVFRDGAFKTLFTLPDDISCIGWRAGGGIWICTAHQFLEADLDQQPRAVTPFPAAVTHGGPQTLLEDHTGAIWIGTAANGIFRVCGTNVEAAPSSYFDIVCFDEDREGNIWAGTGGGGLERLRPRIIELLGPDSGLPNESVRSTCQDTRGAIWVATQNGLVARRQNGRWETLETGTNSLDGSATCVAAASDGGIWIGTRDNGFFYWKDGRRQHWTQEDGLSSDNVRTILQSSNGDVFISTDTPSRIQRLRNGRLEPVAMSFPHRSLRSIVEDARGNVWVASADGVLMRIDGDKLVDETPGVTNRLLSIRCLYPAPDGSLWIGYANWGIGRLKDGKFYRFTSDKGLYDDYVSQMVADDRGWLWCAGNRGMFRVSLAQLNDIAEGRDERVRSIAYGPGEGANLEANYENGSSAFRSSSGRLFFPMRTGLAIVHTENVPHGAPPPPVIVERIAVDDDRTVALYDPRLGQNSADPLLVNLGLGASSILKFSPNNRKLAFEFTALSFTSPEDVQFAYRLENFDEDWVEAGTLRQAAYSRLSPGRYRFDVRACNSDGEWSPHMASVSFEVTPFYWQTWWFRSAAVFAFTLSVIAIVRYVSFRRLRRQLATLEQQAALQRERTRIAKDIHDDLGANLTQIAFLGELAHQDRGEPDKTADRVEKISATARQAIKSLDEIVWAVNPRNDTLAHLMDYAGQFALDYLRLAGIRCRLDFPEECPPRELSTDLRHNLFLVIKEALHNIVKHAHASEVRLRIQFDMNVLDVTIDDNGCGFDPAQARNGGTNDALADGLRNMRQRMNDIGGEFEFQSGAGMGTKIHLSLPLANDE
ncbi:MAG TPA: two-component regulator propeller domain-containing protein [Candidatus Sulfotelmatobacter sp.]|nr:two-component regulator propeller domain-containing protein [Candidatus Sulfotelmatobacter sp.]